MGNSKAFLNSFQSDIRITLYKATRFLLIFMIFTFMVKFFFLDTVTINNEHMSPLINNGDKVLLSKAQHTPYVSRFFPIKYQSTVLFHMPHRGDSILGCLRISGMSGDTISISEGTLSVKGDTSLTIKKEDTHISPPEYSPRDFHKTYVLPQKGDTLHLDSLKNIRDMVFAYSLIRQENPLQKYTLNANVRIQDSLLADYYVDKFVLYSGWVNSVPFDKSLDWFFWDRLDAFLKLEKQDRKAELKLSIHDSTSVMNSYVFKHKSYFLTADNWDIGYDSRYFGPVSESKFKGTALYHLWSTDTTAHWYSQRKFKDFFKPLHGK